MCLWLLRYCPSPSPTTESFLPTVIVEASSLNTQLAITTNIDPPTTDPTQLNLRYLHCRLLTVDMTCALILSQLKEIICKRERINGRMIWVPPVQQRLDQFKPNIKNICEPQCPRPAFEPRKGRWNCDGPEGLGLDGG